MMCWHKYPKEWSPLGPETKSFPATRQYKRCEKCSKIKVRRRYYECD